jgi:hypothetical protein
MVEHSLRATSLILYGALESCPLICGRKRRKNRYSTAYTYVYILYNKKRIRKKGEKKKLNRVLLFAFPFSCQLQFVDITQLSSVCYSHTWFIFHLHCSRLYKSLVLLAFNLLRFSYCFFFPSILCRSCCNFRDNIQILDATLRKSLCFYCIVEWGGGEGIIKIWYNCSKHFTFSARW